MYWVKNFTGSYTNIEIAHFLGVKKFVYDEGGYEILARTVIGEGTIIEKFKTEKEAQTYLDELIHKAMKGF